MTSRVLVEEPAPRSLSAYGKARSTVQGTPLTSEELRKTHAYWRAWVFLSSSEVNGVPCTVERAFPYALSERGAGSSTSTLDAILGLLTFPLCVRQIAIFPKAPSPLVKVGLEYRPCGSCSVVFRQAG